MKSIFNTAAKEALRFLESNYEFRIVGDSDDYVRFENAYVTVVAAYDQQRSYEVSISLGLKEDPQPLFDLGYILRSKQVDVAKLPVGYQMPTIDGARELIFKLAKLLNEFGPDLLQGKERAWRKISELREADSTEYAFKRDMKAAQSEARLAWEKKDFFRVVRTLSPWEASLSNAEKKRFEYAKKMISI